MAALVGLTALESDGQYKAGKGPPDSRQIELAGNE